MPQLLQHTQRSQIKDVAVCHLQCFPSSLSSKMGIAYAAKTLEWFLAADNRFLFHIASDHRVVAYCGGFSSLYQGDGSTSGMLQYAMHEAIAGIIKKPYLLFHPELLKRYPLIFKNIYRRIGNIKKSEPIHIVPASNSVIGLVVIGVHPDFRGKGYFEMLMNEFERISKEKKAEKITLSVKASNSRAIAAYKRQGWQIATEKSDAIEMFKILPDF